MTIGSVALPHARPRADRSLAPFVEFLLVGGATPFVFALAWVLRRTIGLDAADYAFGFTTFYAAYVVNDPHFAVTYFLFYKDARRRALGADVPRAARVRYVLAGALVPAALVAWAAFALVARSAQALGWMVQLMFLLVGWHYVKQGFGVLAVLAARRGASIAGRERAALLFHALAAWAFAWSNPASRGGEFEEKGVVYWAPAHPRWLEIATGAVLAMSVVALVLALIARRRRGDRALPAGPFFAYLVTLWSWSIGSAIDPLVQYVIPALHSVQYGYFVWLMTRNAARANEGPPTFGPPVAVRVGGLAASALVLAWVLFHGAPGLLDGALSSHGRHARHGAPLDDLGATPFFAAFYVVVNLHHYFMDTVIWRRDNPDTRYLRSSPSVIDEREHA